MPFNPCELGGDACSISCVNQFPDIENDILVDHVASGRIFPAIF